MMDTFSKRYRRFRFIYRCVVILWLDQQPRLLYVRGGLQQQEQWNGTEYGFRIYLDDLGSGCTSLSNLCDYPLDVVKIDRNILLKAATNHGKELLTGIIAIAHHLRLFVICEVVETEEKKRVYHSQTMSIFKAGIMRKQCLTKNVKYSTIHILQIKERG